MFVLVYILLYLIFYKQELLACEYHSAKENLFQSFSYFASFILHIQLQSYKQHFQLFTLSIRKQYFLKYINKEE